VPAGVQTQDPSAMDMRFEFQFDQGARVFRSKNFHVDLVIFGIGWFRCDGWNPGMYPLSVERGSFKLFFLQSRTFLNVNR